MKSSSPPSIVEGKRCVVVASSGYLRGRGKKSKAFIESFDLVVKSSDVCEIYDPFGELGTRCDVWYGLPKVKAWQADLQAMVKQNVQLMVIQPNRPEYAHVWQQCHQWLNEQLQTVSLRYEEASGEVYQEMIDALGCYPFSGYFAIRDLLHRGAAHVYAYGHDFFESGYFKESEIYDVVDSGWHLLEPQMRAVWDLLQTEPRFDCDDNLKDLLTRKFAPHDDVTPSVKRLITSELNHFVRPMNKPKVLLFRSCTASVFETLYTELIQCVAPGDITLVCQPGFADTPYISDSHLIINDGERFQSQSLITHEDLSHSQFDICIVPYNGLQLHTYQEVFKTVEGLGMEDVVLVNTRGAMKRFADIGRVLQEIAQYLGLRREFRCLQDKYDRKRAF